MGNTKKKKSITKQKAKKAVKLLLQGASAKDHHLQITEWHQAFLNNEIANDLEVRQDAVAHYAYLSQFFEDLSSNK